MTYQMFIVHINFYITEVNSRPIGRTLIPLNRTQYGVLMFRCNLRLYSGKLDCHVIINDV